MTRPSPTPPAAALARMRVRRPKVCPVCEREFLGLAVQVMCSNACACRAYQQRRKAKKES